MELNVKIESSDYVRAQFVHLRPRPIFWCLGAVILFLLLSLFAAVLFDYIRTRDGSFTLSILSGCIGYLIFVFGVVLPLRAKRTYKQQKLLHQPYIIRITDEDFQSSADYGESTLPWKIFHKWKESKDLFLIYQSDRLFHMLPKRCFPSPEAIDLLRVILLKNLGRPKG